MRLVLAAGFGGALVLMAIAGLHSIRGVHLIETSNARITARYLERHHWLERMRSALYLSSAVTRDYLQERDPETARRQREELTRLRLEMDASLERYAAGQQPEEAALLRDLRGQVDSYWNVLTPVEESSSAERLARGRQFLTSEVMPRRALLLSIADKIDQVHERFLRNGITRSASLFHDFRGRVATMLVLTLGLGALLAAVTITYILRLEREARTRLSQAVAAREELKGLSARLLAAQEEERRSISRELHDEIGQTLSVLLVDLANLCAIAPRGDEQTRSLLASMKAQLETSVQALRNMALLLRPSMLDDLGLVPALEWQAREVSRRTAMRIDVDAEGVADELPEQHRTCIYRVVQEALHNCARHASARSAHVRVRQHAEDLVLEIEDDGKGFDASRIRGLGLIGMEERAEHLGGAFEIHSRQGAGTRIRVRLPLPVEAREKAVQAAL